MAVEAGMVFVDTNILLYAHDRSAGEKFSVSRKLIEELWDSEQGCLSLQVLQEFYVNVTQKIPKPVERSVARQLISELGHWHLHKPDIEDLLQANDLQQMHLLSFWDAMIIQSAARMGCHQLISEDFNHGQVFGDVMVINPFVGK